MNTSDVYEKWKEKPGPATMTPLIKALDPVVRRSLSTHGYSDDPNMITAARLHLSRGLQRFDPSKSNIETWATNELKRIPRIAQKQRNPVHVPERVSMDLHHIHGVELELRNKLGRVPTAQELADASGLSTTRIGKIRATYGVPTVTENMMNDSTGAPRALAAEGFDHDKLAMELIYGELLPIDQQIVDYTFGWHGQPKLTKTEMARRLKRSPANITQRAMAIAAKVDELDLGSVM